MIFKFAIPPAFFLRGVAAKTKNPVGNVDAGCSNFVSGFSGTNLSYASRRAAAMALPFLFLLDELTAYCEIGANYSTGIMSKGKPDQFPDAAAMKHVHPQHRAASVVLALLVSCVSAAALAQSMGTDTKSAAGWYGGIGIAKSRFIDASRDFGQLDADFADHGFVSQTGGNNTDTGFKGFIGYQFNRYSALEGGYISPGRVDFTTTIAAPASRTISGTFKAKEVWHAGLLGNLPLGRQGFAIYGRLGPAYTRAELHFPGVPASVAVQADTVKNKFVPMVGVGLRFDVTHNLGVRGEWSRLYAVGDSNTGATNIDLYGIDLIVKF